jgi:Tol biopolymer transport system component
MGSTTRVSVRSDGSQVFGFSEFPSISKRGRFVVFSSPAKGLVAGDTNRDEDAFLHDMVSGITERVSVSTGGVEGDRYSVASAVSANGRLILFGSPSTTLVADDTNDADDVFLRDRLAGTTQRVSVTSTGEEADADSYAGSMSPDGSYVVFSSRASNLVLGTTCCLADVFLKQLPQP